MITDANVQLGLDGRLATFILVFASLDLAGWFEGFPTLRFLVRASWWVIYLGIALRLVQRFGSDWIVWLVRRQTLLVVILAIAFLSVSWSLVPLESLRTAASLTATTVLGVYIGYALSPPAIAKSLSIAFAVVIVASLVALPILPDSIVIEPLTGQWQGLMDHKNTFGALSALGFLFFLAPVMRGGSGFWRRLAMCGACGLALVLSRSVTALIACAVGVGALIWPFAAPRIQRASRPVKVVLAIALAGAVVAAGSSVGPITHALGRDPTLGRTTLWAASLRIIRERPLTGYGYTAVWHRREATLLPHIPETADEEASSAHNLALNTATELGVPAAVLVVAYLITTFLDAARSTRDPRSSPYPYVTALLIALMTMNITESYLLAIHYVFWILWVAMAVMLRRNAEGLFASKPA